MITYQTEGVKMPNFKKRENTAWVKAVAAGYGKKVGEIAYIFVDDEKILEVNRQYLQHDYYTDIITFDYTEGDIISGDLFISLDTVRTNAGQVGASYDRELHRVMIHGILHLCGTTKARASARSWRLPRTRLWPCILRWGRSEAWHCKIPWPFPDSAAGSFSRGLRSWAFGGAVERWGLFFRFSAKGGSVLRFHFVLFLRVRFILLIIRKLNIILKGVGFSQAIHIFFSGDSSVFLKREICVSLESDFVLSRHAVFYQLPEHRGFYPVEPHFVKYAVKNQARAVYRDICDTGKQLFRT